MNPSRQATIDTRGGPPVTLTGLTLDGDLRGLLFEAAVEQHFHNASTEHVEVAYSFPLPWGAVLLGVDVLLGGRRLQGAIVEKRQAQARYEEALCDGDAAILLERNHDHSHTLNLGNLAPGERCSIRLRYAQLLRFEQGGLRLLVPTVIAPRYGDPRRDGGLQPHQVPVHDLLAEHPLDLQLRLHGPLARARVASPSHPIAVAHSTGTDDDGALVTVTLARAAHLDRDVVLVLDQLSHDGLAVAGLDAVTPGGVAVLASLRPRIAADGPNPLAMKLLVDCSGSMAGDSIAAARQALQGIVQQLGEGDRFSLSRFGSDVVHHGRGLWTVTQATRAAARDWVDALQADLGGTELQTALCSTFALAQTVRSDVLLLTDGAIEAVDLAIAAAREAGHRVFVVGIGNAPAESHLRRLAEATGGACDFVAGGEAVAPAVLRMVHRLRLPSLHDLRLDWPAGMAPLWATPLPAGVFDGDTVHVLALLPQTPAGTLRLLARPADAEAPLVIGEARLPQDVTSADTLARMAAWARCHDADTRPADATRLAVAHQLLTADTNFLLVHARAEGERATAMPVLHQVPQMAPAGWQGLGTVDRAVPMPAMINEMQAVSWSAYQEAGMIRSMMAGAGVGGLPCIAAMMVGELDAAEDAQHNPFAAPVPDTPLAMARWLAPIDSAAWPGSCDGLRQAGLPAPVVDWLQRVIDTQDGSHRERAVVRAFLFLMAAPRLLLALEAGNDLSDALHVVVSTAALPQCGVDVSLVSALAFRLGTMTADAWPASLLALDGVAPGA